MTLDEHLKNKETVRVVGIVDAADDNEVSIRRGDCHCGRRLTLPREAIREIIGSTRSDEPVEVVIDPAATVSVAAVFGADGILGCTCQPEPQARMTARTPTTTVERCRQCGCRYDGWFGCHCPTQKRYDCAAGNQFHAPEVFHGG